ncbi:MAG TPA: type III-A CRISPR-associated protein Cas10/Csm1 [Ignavibacteria bacterium]|nr:type III-A CRISPR-associated protein Cas10/Csm1 [Ignavibacteria bacterium]
MYTPEEKILILGSLFHDVGKFEQRCTENPDRKTHQVLGAKFVDDLKTEFTLLLDNDQSAFERMRDIILRHHNKDLSDELIKIVQTADHISAGERVDKESNEEMGEEWSHKYLSSLFSKIKLLSDNNGKLRYYKQVELTKGNYDAMIPLEKAQAELNRYSSRKYVVFFEDIQNVLQFYNSIKDFDTIVNLILIVFEKYMWCIPDFTGSSETDISLYNHLKDVCGLSLAIFKSKKDENLNLVIGDLPGIQDYIFGIVNKKPAKILRGRSINVQVLTRNFATKFLEALGLTEANLVMLAGGKFYILAQNNEDFKNNFDKAVESIETFLINEYNFDLQFNAAYDSFKYEELKNKTKSFGEVIEKATDTLNSNKHKLFKKQLNPVGSNSFVLDKKYIDSKGEESDNIKCKVTDKPIEEGRRDEFQDLPDDKYIQVDKVVKVEHEIGHQIVEDNLVIQFKEDSAEVEICQEFKEYCKNENRNEEAVKILVNPKIDTLLKEKDNINLIKKMKFFEVANYTSGDKNVMSFEKMSEVPKGAKYLSLIKGDIDNLGMIMAYGLTDDKQDLTGISRITTLSNHLKYYFSFFMNGFLKKIDNEGISVNGKEFKSNSYVIFAGGDDLMLVCPQIKSLELLYEFNEKFNEFVCHNPEVHISYSITNFNHSTPIKIVAELSEENQKKAKESEKAIQKIKSEKDEKTKCEDMINDKEFFNFFKNKATTFLFNTNIKNNLLNEVLKLEDSFYRWHEAEPQKISMGVIRNTLRLTEIMKEWKNGDSSKLIWHPYLSYMINRNLKTGIDYKDAKIGELYEEILSLNKKQSSKLTILNPALCGVIYKLRG